MKEPSKPSIAQYRPIAYSNAVPLERWLERPTTIPEFDRGHDLLEWIVEHGTILCDNLAPLQATNDINLPSFLGSWICGDVCPKDFFSTDGWLPLGEYRVRPSRAGNKLSVRRGNKYGALVDLGGLSGSNWPGIVAALKQAGIYNLPYPSTQGSIAASLLSAATPKHTLPLPAEIIKLAWQCCKGPRMEALTLGTFDGYAYDISSAYPAVLGALPSCEPGTWCQWFESTEFQPSAVYGLAMIDTCIPTEWRAGPLAVRTSRPEYPDDDLELHFPVGRLTGVYVTMPDMRLLADLGIPFIIHKAWWGSPIHHTAPFQRLVSLLWEMREVDKDFAKRVAVAVVGQLGSVHRADDGERWEAGGFFAPVYFSHVYAEVRARIFRKALEAGLEHIHAFTVDGIITDGRLTTERPGLGAWREESQGEFFLASDVFKDRPNNDGRWRAFVETTPDHVLGNWYEAEMDTYVTLPLIWRRRSLEPYLGDIVEQKLELPLGSDHRLMPGAVRQDYLRGAIPTWLPTSRYT